MSNILVLHLLAAILLLQVQALLISTTLLACLMQANLLFSHHDILAIIVFSVLELAFSFVLTCSLKVS